MKPTVYLSDEAYIHNLRPMLKRIERETREAEAAKLEQRKAARKAAYEARKQRDGRIW